MAKFAKRVMPKGIIANDAGKALDGSGIAGLARLDGVDVAAAAVGSMSARIGDGVSTFEDGVISAVNNKAKQAGVVVGEDWARSFRGTSLRQKRRPIVSETACLAHAVKGPIFGIPI